MLLRPKSSLRLSFKKEARRGAAEKRVFFFFEKKKQKTFTCGSRPS
jgi:hypothetical protein